MISYCRDCGKKLQRWGRTRQNKPRFFCLHCKKTTITQRNTVKRRHALSGLQKWLRGKSSLTEIATQLKVSRQTLSRRFSKVLQIAEQEPVLPQMIPAKILIVDGTYIHGHSLCALIAIDEYNKIYWKFAPYESYAVWCDFLSSFKEPELIVMDGQKGLFAAAKTLWPQVPIQRCQFHLIAFAIQYIGRRPKEEVGQKLLDILYTLKYVKTIEEKQRWIGIYTQWEERFSGFISAKNNTGNYYRPKIRSARLIIRRALPNLFTFLEYPGAPSTTNLVEGWVNSAMAEALRLHRGLRVHEKKALATIILSSLRRKSDRTNLDVATLNTQLEKIHQDRTDRFLAKQHEQKNVTLHLKDSYTPLLDWLTTKKPPPWLFKIPILQNLHPKTKTDSNQIQSNKNRKDSTPCIPTRSIESSN